MEITQYEVQVSDMMFCFRSLSRSEYKSIFDQSLNELDFQEAVCQLGVVLPLHYDFSSGPAGIAESLSQLILEASDLLPGQAKSLLDAFREEMRIFDFQADALIHEAFPEFTLHEIQSWTVRKTLYYLSRAEYILQHLRGVAIVQAENEQQTTTHLNAKSVNASANALNHFPELSWFEAQDDLTGDFD